MPLIALYGGPKHGELIEVPDDQLGQPLRVARLLPIVGRWGDDLRAENLPVEVVEYEAVRFDHQTRMWVYEVKPETPAPARDASGMWRWCRECDVKWWGDVVCWCCEKPLTLTTPAAPPPGGYRRWPSG